MTNHFSSATKYRESWLFGESLEPTQSKRWAILLGLNNDLPKLIDFDRELVLETIKDGGGAIDLASSRIYEWLNDRLKQFDRQTDL